MAESRSCPSCGTQLPADAPDAPCPACLMQLGLKSWENRQTIRPTIDSPSPEQAGSGFVPLSPAELAARFPQYEILDLIGYGGMGAVYKAKQKSLDRFVAIKTINPSAAGDQGFAERFAREVRALARLNHPNIVGVHDFGESDGLYYFVMEYVEGVNLRQLIESKELAPDQAIQIIPQVCEALQFAHDEGIVHRDIKPENILIDSRGRAKIADFGLAKLADNKNTDRSLTGTHQVMGTPRYMAPEQMEGARHVDHRADIFSLGVVFYEMLTGELPLGRFDPPSAHAGVNANLDQVVLRTLEKEPNRRYQHASQMKLAVESVSESVLPPVRHPVANAAASPVGQNPVGQSPVPADTAEMPNYGMLMMGGVMGLVGLTLLSLSLFQGGSVVWLWVGLGIALGGGGCFSGAFSDGSKVPVGTRPNIGLLMQGAMMLVVGFGLLIFSGWQSGGIGRIHPGNVFVWVGIGLSLGGGGCMAGAWQKDKKVAKERRAVKVQERAAARPKAWPLNGPSIGLLFAGALNFSCILPWALLAYFGMTHQQTVFGSSVEYVMGWLFVSALAGVPVVIAALTMRQRAAYRFSMFGAIFAALPLTPGALLGIPMGLWALAVMTRREVSQAFGRAAESPHAKPGKFDKAKV